MSTTTIMVFSKEYNYHKHTFIKIKIKPMHSSLLFIINLFPLLSPSHYKQNKGAPQHK